MDCSNHSLQLQKLLTFVYQLSPALGPFSQLQCICFFDASSLMNAVHQVITQTIPIIHPFYGSFVIPNLGREERDKNKWHVNSLTTNEQCNVHTSLNYLPKTVTGDISQRISVVRHGCLF